MTYHRADSLTLSTAFLLFAFANQIKSFSLPDGWTVRLRNWVEFKNRKRVKSILPLSDCGEADIINTHSVDEWYCMSSLHPNGNNWVRLYCSINCWLDNVLAMLEVCMRKLDSDHRWPYHTSYLHSIFPMMLQKLRSVMSLGPMVIGITLLSEYYLYLSPLHDRCGLWLLQ